MDKRFWGILLVIAAVLSGIFFLTNSNEAGAPGSSAVKGTLTNHVVGSTSTGVKLVEYGDFQCPACAGFEPTVAAVRAKYAEQIQFQFRNFPLFQIHPNALAASRAAEAADMQGKYWEMHDALYANQQAWSGVSNPQAAFEAYATELKLDITKFKTDLKSSTTNDRVQADVAEGNKLGVNSTPTFFLNGKKISNPDATVEAFSKIIDAEIVKKGGTPKTSSTPAPASVPEASPAE